MTKGKRQEEKDKRQKTRDKRQKTWKKRGAEKIFWNIGFIIGYNNVIKKMSRSFTIHPEDEDAKLCTG